MRIQNEINVQSQLMKGETIVEKNRVRIICNPYEKSIKYMRWCLDEEQERIWKNLGSKSQLLVDEKYTNATIQHNVYEIIKEIAAEYNRGKVGLEIVFDGTKEDYEDLKEVIDKFFCTQGVTCEIGDLYLDSASDVMPKIQKIFDDLTQVFDEYGSDSDEINQIIKKFLDATRTEIPICVVGMYSTGKSAFINALIGAEVLPSAVKPTTARNYKIIESEKDGSIKFCIDEEKVSIHYEDDKYKIVGNIDKELMEDLHGFLEKVDNASLTKNMYYSLSIINEYADKTKKIADLIEVEVPFYNGDLVNDKYKFIIFDTPGSDSESHEEHLAVLKKALGDQTNGLPILLTSPKDMDRTGADKLLEVVDGIAGNLDLTNAMIIVNQADAVSGKSLDKVKEGADTILSRWKFNRLYFMSAIMGLGSKKEDYEDEDDWIDADYEDVFFNNINCFTKYEERRYKQLYLHNQIAPNRMESYLSRVDGEKGDRRLLYINSGLHCVENEILDFARKYALYNKCAQAQEYLEDAIDSIREKIGKIEDKVEKTRKSTQDKQDKQKQELLKKLADCITAKTKEYTDSYPTYMQVYVNELVQVAEGDIFTFVTDIWQSVKEKDTKERVDDFLSLSKEAFNQKETKCRNQILQYSKEYWSRNKEKLQVECCNIIKDDENLSQEEQRYLNEFIMKLSIYLDVDAKINVSPDDVSIHLINLFGYRFLRLNRIDQKRTKKIYFERLEQYIRKVNNRINDAHTNEFKRWNKRLETGLTKEVAKFNPKLRELSAELEKYQKQIDKYQNQLDLIEENQYKIVQMFEFKKREDEKSNGCSR